MLFVGILAAGLSLEFTVPAATPHILPLPDKLERESAHLKSPSPALADYEGDLRQIIPPSLSMTWDILSGVPPHGVLLLEEGDGGAAELRETLRNIVDLARNADLVVEYQITTKPPFRAGLIVSHRIPTLTLNWEAHPYEDVPTAGTLWRQPFADLGDVAEILREGDTATLLLTAAATQRIDAHAGVHGHRRFSARYTGPGENVAAGPYTWMTGLRRVSGLPPLFDAAPDQQVSLETLRQQFAARVTARNHLVTRLDLGVDIVWTALPVKPRYRRPVTLWVTPREEWAGESSFYAPWLGAPDQPRRWVALRSGSGETVSIALPPSWCLEGYSADTEPLVLAENPTAMDETGLHDFLSQYVGSEMAVLMGGEVIGIVPVADVRRGRMELAAHAPAQHAAITSLWDALCGGLAPPSTVGKENSETSRTARSEIEDDSFFQVRLMAEPQDREIIPVTHFAAPGAAGGVLVAVQNDVILDSHVVAGARLETQADRLYLHLRLTPEGQDALSDACFAHIGKQLAILYEDQLLCAPTIIDWEQEELSFKGMNADWPDVAKAMMERLNRSVKGDV